MPPNLDEVAQLSAFSKFHFHRLFKQFTGETLNQFTKRIRLERAAFILMFHKDRTITDVALSCGFSTSQNFSTAFKKYFNITPKAYKENKGCQGVIVHDPLVVAKYDIELIYIDSFKVVYERNFGTYSNENFNIKRKKVSSKHPNEKCIGIFWDDPTITLGNSCRYDYGYIINSNAEYKEVATQTIEANRYIVLTLNIDNIDTIDSVKIWDYLYTNWLLRHGYIPDTLFCFETIHSNKIQFYIPIKKI